MQSFFTDHGFLSGCRDRGIKKCFAIYPDNSVIRMFQKVQAAQQGGLAGAGRAQNGNNVSLFHTQVHAVQDVQCAAHPAGSAARERPDVEAGLVIIGVKCFVDVFDL